MEDNTLYYGDNLSAPRKMILDQGKDLNDFYNLVGSKK